MRSWFTELNEQLIEERNPETLYSTVRFGLGFAACLMLLLSSHYSFSADDQHVSETCPQKLGNGSNTDFEWTDEPSFFASIRASWALKNFSSAAKHDPNAYIYTIKMIREPFSLEEARAQIDLIPLQNEASASLISKLFAGVLSMSRWGVILEIPPENIIATAPFDMNSGRSGSGLSLLEMQRTFGLHTPEYLLREGAYGSARIDRSKVRGRRGTWMDDKSWNAGEWNEVKYLGHLDKSADNILYSPVRVVGLIRFGAVKGLPESELPSIVLMQSAAASLGIPFVFVVAPK